MPKSKWDALSEAETSGHASIHAREMLAEIQDLVRRVAEREDNRAAEILLGVMGDDLETLYRKYRECDKGLVG